MKLCETDVQYLYNVLYTFYHYIYPAAIKWDERNDKYKHEHAYCHIMLEYLEKADYIIISKKKKTPK